MTRKDYVKFAAMLKAAKPDDMNENGADNIATITWRRIVEETANVFAADNQQFDHDRFYAACGTAQ